MKYKIYKVGLTGSTGVIGSVLNNRLKKKYKIFKFRGDIRNKKDVFQWIEKYKFDYLIHLAAKVDIKEVNKNKSLAYQVNFGGTRNIVEGLKKYNNKCMIFFASTSHVYNFSKKKINENSLKKPITLYGQLKLKSENYLIKNYDKSKVCVGRIFSFTHFKQNKNFFVPSIFDKIKNDMFYDVLKIQNEYRDFVSVDDICRAIEFFIEKKISGIFNICNGKKIHLTSIVNFFCFNLNKVKIKKNYKTLKREKFLVGNNQKIKKLGFNFKSNIYDILNEFIENKY